MSKILYADNFRGFKNTFVELRDVSFFVGENSSGKSSLLALSHLLQGSAFWINPDFNCHGHEFGAFNDLVSQAGVDRREFTVGYCQYPTVSAENSTPGFLSVISFRSDKGRAVPHRCTYLHGKDIISFVESSVGYRYQVLGTLGESFPLNLDLLSFKKIVGLHGSQASNRGRVIKQSRKPPKNVILFSVPFLIDNDRKSGQAKESGSDGFFIPNDITDGVWFAPIRTKPQRVYHATASSEYSPEGSHTPYLMREMLRRRSKSAKGLQAIVNKFGDESGLFNKLQIHSFGRENASPFEVTVNLDGSNYSLGNVGYGVSQVIPILFELLSRSGGFTYYVQQPEVHLHPKAQAALANVFYLVAAVKPSEVVVETHSDFLIDRFRYLLKSGFCPNYKKPNASVYWFSREGGFNTVAEIPISESGELSANQPDGYRHFFINESLSNLSL